MPRIIGDTFSFETSLISTFTGEINIEVRDVCLNYQDPFDGQLPYEIIENKKSLNIILKYQNYFKIWNNDQSFNEKNFKVLMEEINTGLL